MKYLLRFIFIYLMVVVSFFVFFFSSMSEHNDKLSIAKLETNGVKYLKTLYSLTINVADYKGALLLENAENNIAILQKKITSDIQDTYKLQAEFPEFKSSDLNRHLNELSKFSDTYDYYEFLDFINHENYRIGDISKLLFVEDRKTYFLSSLLTHYMPEYLISSIINHNIVEMLRFKTFIDEKHKDLYTEQNKLILLSSEEINGIVKLLNKYKDTKRLSFLINKIITELELSQKYVNSIKNWSVTDNNIKEYINLSHDILKLSKELNDENIILIERAITHKIKSLESRILTDTILVTILIILITLIFVYLYYSFRLNLKKDAEIKGINETLDKLVIFSKTDIDGNITYVSSALQKLTGYSKEELIGKNHRLFKHKEMEDSIYRDMWDTVTSNKTWVGEFLNTSKDGSSYWIKATISPDHNDKGEIIAYSAYMVNISNQKELEIEKAKTQEALEFKSKFLSNMSHEIRTPLNAIVGLTYVTLKTNLDKKQKDLITKVQSASNILLGIINDILDISKIESGKMSIEKEPFNLKETAGNIIDILSTKAQEQSITLDIEYKNISNFTFIGDSLRVSQILTNLINNAIKFTSRGGVSVIVERTDKETLLFSVKDSGIGLKKDQMKTLFDEFTQADMSTSRKYGGTGLGLSISKHLIELMGGTIWVKSDFGVGSTFNFKLPFENAKNDKSSNDKEKDIETMQKELNSLKDINILLAEDNHINQMVFEMLLEDFKLNIDFADDGQIAVNKFQNNDYDIIFMDIQMPNMNGFEATTHIREVDKTTPIVGLSANAMKEDIDKAMEYGMNDYLAKPIEVDKLYPVLLKHLKA